MTKILHFFKVKLSLILALTLMFNILNSFNPLNNIQVDSQPYQTPSFMDPEPAKMSDFWNGDAEWKVYNHIEMLYPERWEDPNSPNYYSIIDEGNYRGGYWNSF